MGFHCLKEEDHGEGGEEGGGARGYVDQGSGQFIRTLFEAHIVQIYFRYRIGWYHGNDVMFSKQLSSHDKLNQNDSCSRKRLPYSCMVTA